MQQGSSFVGELRGHAVYFKPGTDKVIQIDLQFEIKDKMDAPPTLNKMAQN